MSDINKLLYTARVHTTGGREGGRSRADNGHLDISLTTPGLEGAGTNPEQLLAAGWSSCFLSALLVGGRKLKITVPSDVSVDAEIDLGTNDGGYQLGARLHVSLPGIPAEDAQKLIDMAHETCPYSKAVRGNIPVSISLV